MTPTAIVIDRSTAPRMETHLAELGGAWAAMFKTWRGTDMKYLVLLAHTRKRMRLRAPLIWMARDDEGLRAAMLAACAHLNDTKCRWAIFMEEGTAGTALVRERLSMDSSMEGRS